jgi:hypothetical protein
MRACAFFLVFITACGFPRPARLGDDGVDAGTGIGTADAPTTCTGDLDTADNCGACGHSCGGGVCNGGVCEPVAIPGITTASSLAVAGNTLYFTSDHLVLACPKSGCVNQPTQLDDQSINGYATWSVQVANGTLFFMSAPTQQGTEHDDLFNCPLAGCPSPPQIIAPARFGVDFLGTLGYDVFFADFDAKYTARRTCQPSYGACEPQVNLIDQGYNNNEFAASTDQIFYVDGNGVEKCPYAGCGTPSVPTKLSASLPTGITYSAGLVYMKFGNANQTLSGAIRTCTPGDCDGDKPKDFIIHRDPIDAFTIDADGVYWIEDQRLYACPRTGCVGGPKTLATNVTRAIDGRNPWTIVTDAAFVYWINDTAGIAMRIAKPLAM